MQTLRRPVLGKITPQVPLQLPADAVFTFPERVLQFGTGVLLRGLCEAVIHQSNTDGTFAGRVLVVKSTGGGDADAFARQDGLYTHVIRGLENGQAVERFTINAALSRVLSAATDWDEILRSAESPAIQTVLSNTTEVGLQRPEHEDLTAHPPVSFPGKLLAWLHHRWQHFGGSAESGVVVVPTELVPDNGRVLQTLVEELAAGLEPAFLDWLGRHNRFCSSLVDRIVPGKPTPAQQAEFDRKLGYQDDLTVISEPYLLWAIEGDDTVRQRLGFTGGHAGVIVSADIELFRELKLRLLNGTHTLLCGLAFLSGHDTVRQAMNDPLLADFTRKLLFQELIPGMPYPVETPQAEAFARQVLDRFANPFLEHSLLSITLNYTAKMQMRNLPLLLTFCRKYNRPPDRLCLGFAAYLHFMRPVMQENGKFFGERNGQRYALQDPAAGWFARWWAAGADLREVLANRDFWEEDLTALPGFAARVAAYVEQMQQKGVRAVLEQETGSLH